MRAVLIGTVLLAACEPAKPGTDGCTERREKLSAPVGACKAQEASLPEFGAAHVTESATYTCSNPPASGPHFGQWGIWGTHATTLRRENWMHNLEHGGVALLHKCTDCQETVSQLEAIVAAQQKDPICGPNVHARFIITADPLLDRPIAAAAWQNLYVADCVDAATLGDFIARRYGMAPERTCAEGSVP